MEPIFGFMLFLAACIIVAIVASKRGRSGWIFFFCTLGGGFLLAIIVSKIGGSFWAGVWAFLSPIIGFVVALASETGQEMAVQRGEYGGYKKCPFCAEPVRREAIKCKHCGSELPAVSLDAPVQTPERAPGSLSDEGSRKVAKRLSSLDFSAEEIAAQLRDRGVDPAEAMMIAKNVKGD